MSNIYQNLNFSLNYLQLIYVNMYIWAGSRGQKKLITFFVAGSISIRSTTLKKVHAQGMIYALKIFCKATVARIKPSFRAALHFTLDKILF